MSSLNKKTTRSTGPKSKQGKAKSSLNAVSHGLTSNRVLPDEFQMVEDFSQELAQYYKPESPLEVLQIQRIAYCRAKLAKLIDIEFAGREIARKEIDVHPEYVMNRLIQYPKYLRNLVLQDMAGHSIFDSFRMNLKDLLAICQEINGFFGLLDGEEDLPNFFPKLCLYLNKIPQAPDQLPELGLDQKLMVFAQRIRNLLFDDSSKFASMPEFEQTLKIIKDTETVNNMAKRKILRQKMPGNSGYHQSVLVDLKAITDLHQTILQMPAVIESFENMKSWMIRAIDLSAEESARMMKYQTMLERRLSTAIGELLEIQKIRKNN